MLWGFFLVVNNIAGGQSAFVLDYNLTFEDCLAIKEQWVSTIDEHSSVHCMPQETQIGGYQPETK